MTDLEQPTSSPVQTLILCSASAHTNCGRTLNENTITYKGRNMNNVPYVCMEDYRAGWRSEGLRGTERVYKLPEEKIPRAVV